MVASEMYWRAMAELASPCSSSGLPLPEMSCGDVKTKRHWHECPKALKSQPQPLLSKNIR